MARKVVSPSDFADLEELAEHPLAFGEHHERVGESFAWKFTRYDLDRLLSRLTIHQPSLFSSAAA